MASISRDNRTNSLSIYFRFHGKAYRRSLHTADEREADRARVRVEDSLADISKGRLLLPDGADIVHLVLTGGRQERPARVSEQLTIESLFTKYFESLPDGAKEVNTLGTERTHRNHIVRLLGKQRVCESLVKVDFQQYILDRSREKHRRKPIRAETIKKELDTLRAVWNRSYKLGHLKRPLDFEGLDWPKRTDKQPFRTREQIEQAIRRGGLTPEQIADLWEGLFLGLDEIEELLAYAHAHSRNPYFYPLLVFLAHTGARKSEAIRCRVEDVRFDDGVVVIREKKKARGRETTRRVDLSDKLGRILGDYLKADHPGGAVLFTDTAGTPLLPGTLQKAWNSFFRKRKKSDPKWAVLRGFHVLRHSFASNLARSGVDQRVIDELMGHETEAMRKRYRHLFPDQTRDAVRRLFG